MSQEVYQIVETMDQSELETQLALQCAPLLMRIKMSNLLIVHKSNRDVVYKLFRKTAISYYVIYELENKIVFLLYRKNELVSYLNKEEVREVIKMLGYNKYTLKNILKEFIKRYGAYRKGKDVFPHEMGLLLGYPVDDVAGFIVNQGKNFLYTGYWKVYSNLSEAIQMFDKYNQAQKMVIQMISQGVSIQNILNIDDSNQYKQITI